MIENVEKRYEIYKNILYIIEETLKNDMKFTKIFFI